MANVLLIDDDDKLREILAIAMEQAGHKVTQAEDGQKGVDLARVSEVDIVITDLVMPVKEGVETILTLRRERPKLPIIAMSGGVSNSKLYLDIAGKIGAKRMLPKPFALRQLITMIEEVLNEERAKP